MFQDAIDWDGSMGGMRRDGHAVSLTYLPTYRKKEMMGWVSCVRTARNTGPAACPVRSPGRTIHVRKDIEHSKLLEWDTVPCNRVRGLRNKI